MTTVFNRPTMLMQYPDDSYRFVSREPISEGDHIEWIGHNWKPLSGIVTAVHEARPAMGDYGENSRPNSYRLTIQ
jgi:hypothetical protein